MTKKKKAIVYLKRDQLIISVENNLTDFILNFDESLVKNEEVQDQSLLGKTVADFFIRNEIYISKFILVLDDEILFYKDLSSINEYYRATLINEFMSNVPFDKSKVFIKTIEINDSFFVISANKDYVKTVSASIENTGCDNIAILPYFLIHNLESPFRLFKNKQLISKLNLLKSTNDDSDKIKFNNVKSDKTPVETTDKIHEDDVTAENKPKRDLKPLLKKILLILIIFLLFSSAVGVIAYYFLTYESANKKTISPVANQNPIEAIQQNQSNTAPQIETSNTQPAVNETDLSKEKLNTTILILNGTGIPKLASSVASDLIKVGYDENNITLGNEFLKDVTTLEYTDDVSLNLLSELEGILNQMFDEVVSSNVSDAIEYSIEGTQKTFDIRITTGIIIDK